MSTPPGDAPPPQGPGAAPPADPRDAYFDVSGLQHGMGRRVGNASVWVLAITGFKMVMLFGGIMITARLIPPAQYGIFAMAMPAVVIALSLSSLGLPQAIVQRKTITHAEASSLFWMNIALAGLVALVLVLCAGLAAEVFGQPEVAAVYRVIPIAVVLAAVVGQYGAMLKRRLRIAEFERLVLAGEAAGLVVVVITALMGWSYWALVAQQITAQAVTLALAIRRTGWLPSGPQKARFAGLWDAVRFGGFVAGIGIVNKLMNYTGTVVAGAQLGPAATGLYTRAVRLGNLPGLRIMSPLSGSFVPSLARLQDQPKAMQEMFVRLISRANLILLPVAVIIAAGAEPIVAIMLGPDWMGAAPLLFWMSLLTLRAGANHGLSFALMACGQSKPLFFNILIRFALVAGVIYLTARHGLEVMTAAYMLTELLITLPMMMFVALRYTPITFDCILRASLDGMALAVVLAAALIVFVNPLIAGWPALAQLVVLTALTGAAYGVRIALSPGMRRDVRGILDRIAGRLRKRGQPAE